MYTDTCKMISALIMLLIQELQVHLRQRLILQILLYQVMYYIHDMDASGFGYPLGQIPRMDVLSFEADKHLIDVAKEACAKVLPEIGTHIGRVVSGDQFISDKAVKERISANFDGYCTEMEGAAIAQAAYLNKVPFVILRAISDKADDSATMDYPTFEKQAIENSVKLIKELVGQI